jgi:hypothetical protein
MKSESTKKKDAKVKDLAKKGISPREADAIRGGVARRGGDDDDDLDELEVQR